MAGEVRDQGVWWGRCGGLKGSPCYDGGDAVGEKATAQEGGGEADERVGVKKDILVGIEKKGGRKMCEDVASSCRGGIGPITRHARGDRNTKPASPPPCRRCLYPPHPQK